MTRVLAVMRRVRAERDLYAGILLLLMGAVAMLEGLRLGSGTLADMGPGYVPLMLGVALIGLGLVLGVTAVIGGVELEEMLTAPDWRGWLCILAGGVIFIVLGIHAGLVPATFCTVFVAAMGDRTATLGSSILVAAAATIFGALLFHTGLQIAIPLFVGWP